MRQRKKGQELEMTQTVADPEHLITTTAKEDEED